MIIEQHYDDEVLIDLLDEAEEDSHVPACDTCAGTLESYRDLSAALHDDSVWDERELPETPAPQTTNFLRAFAERTRAEDIGAGPIVAKLIADPSAIEQHPEWRTAGVVRGLLAYFDKITYTDPKRAVDISTLAASIADSINVNVFSVNALSKLRALAFREKAWALFYTGSFPASIAALDRADEHLAESFVSECDGAEVRLLRARVYRDLERFDEAIQLARASCATFQRYGNRRRAAVAEAIESSVLMHLRRYREALEIDERILSDALLDDESRASALNRTAYSLRELSVFGEAKARFAQAMNAFERLGLMDKRSMARWGLARVLLYEGSAYEAALSAFGDLRLEFEQLGMAHDLALVSLDAVETLLSLNRPAEVVELCRSAIEYFAKVGLEYSSAAMTALAHLREAAASGVLVPSTVREVRSYFELLPKQPHLLFAFPL